MGSFLSPPTTSSLEPCFSHCSFWTSSVITWERVRNADSQALPGPPESVCICIGSQGTSMHMKCKNACSWTPELRGE